MGDDCGEVAGGKRRSKKKPTTQSREAETTQVDASQQMLPATPEVHNDDRVADTVQDLPTALAADTPSQDANDRGTVFRRALSQLEPALETDVIDYLVDVWCEEQVCSEETREFITE